MRHSKTKIVAIHEFNIARFVYQTDIDYWYSYVTQGLKNEIQGHCRKDQRTYQRKFCNAISRKQRFEAMYPEFLI